jgi:hypothetical protein
VTTTVKNEQSDAGPGLSTLWEKLTTKYDTARFLQLRVETDSIHIYMQPEKTMYTKSIGTYLSNVCGLTTGTIVNWPNDEPLCGMPIETKGVLACGGPKSSQLKTAVATLRSENEALKSGTLVHTGDQMELNTLLDQLQATTARAEDYVKVIEDLSDLLAERGMVTTSPVNEEELPPPIPIVDRKALNSNILAIAAKARSDVIASTPPEDRHGIAFCRALDIAGEAAAGCTLPTRIPKIPTVFGATGRARRVHVVAIRKHDASPEYRAIALVLGNIGAGFVCVTEEDGRMIHIYIQAHPDKEALYIPTLRTKLQFLVRSKSIESWERDQPMIGVVKRQLGNVVSLGKVAKVDSRDAQIAALKEEITVLNAGLQEKYLSSNKHKEKRNKTQTDISREYKL